MRILVAVVLLVILSPNSLLGQELGFLTAALRNIHNITLSATSGTLVDQTDLAVGSDDCSIGKICGMAAEVLLDVPSLPGTHVEVGLGASYFRGFRERSGSPLEIRGAVRSFPTISAYITKEGHRRDMGFDPYFGVSFGISDLWNIQAYDSTAKEYSIKGQTFDYGVEVGVLRPVGRTIGLFLEADYRRRRFASVDWSVDVVPNGGPKSFNFDAVSVALGVQVSVSGDDDAPPAYTGLWSLTKVDGKELPATMEQHRNSDRTSDRDEVVGGTLAVGDSLFNLNLTHRGVSFDEGSHQIAVSVPSSRNEARGQVKFDRNKDTLLLVYVPGQPEVRVFRAEREITIEFQGHVMQFRKVE